MDLAETIHNNLDDFVPLMIRRSRFVGSIQEIADQLLIYEDHGNENRGYWGHPLIAINVIQKVYSKFSVEMSRIFATYVRNGYVNMTSENRETLSQLFAITNIDQPEILQVAIAQPETTNIPEELILWQQRANDTPQRLGEISQELTLRDTKIEEISRELALKKSIITVNIYINYRDIN